FYPYRHLLDRDWDGVLVEFIPRFLACRDAREYALAIAELSTFVPDGHTRVASRELAEFLGITPPPVGLRMIEGVPVVTEPRDAAAEKAGIQLGDVVVGVAGEAVEKRMARLGKYIAASTPAAHKLYTLQRLLNGPDNSTCKLNVRGPDGKTREVELPRRAAYWRA